MLPRESLKPGAPRSVPNQRPGLPQPPWWAYGRGSKRLSGEESVVFGCQLQSLPPYPVPRPAPAPGAGEGAGSGLCLPPSCPAPGPRFRRPGADGRRPARLPAPGRVCSDGRGSQSQGGRGKPARARALRPAPGRPTLRLKTSRSSSLRSRGSGSRPPPSDPGVQTSALLPRNQESRLQPSSSRHGPGP